MLSTGLHFASESTPLDSVNPDRALAHAEDDYFAIEMAAFEEFVHGEHSSALSFEQSAGKLCRVNPVRTRADATGSGRRQRSCGRVAATSLTNSAIAS